MFAGNRRDGIPPSGARIKLVTAIALGTALFVLAGTFAAAEEASKDQRQWWIDHYGMIEARAEPLVARAEQVFSRVAAAADKKGNRIPKLLVIGGKGDPYALTLRDGSVILTRETLRICYENVAPETGDSRLAFLIGHELAHLAKDDFWHSNAYAAVSSLKDDADVHRVLASQLEKTGGSLDFVKTQELQADSYGIISMTMAGYDPQAIIGPDGTNFFAFWDSRVNTTFDDAVHNSPEARAEFIRTETRPVIDALPRFMQGVQIYQGGNYEVAVTLFESFIEKYPSREVYNNLGLSHYQSAMKQLSECSGGIPVFRLPAALDPETTAQRLRPPHAAKETAQAGDKPYQADLREADRFFEAYEQSEPAGCPRNDPYRANLQEAIRFLEEAGKKDAAYVPARINISSALIMAGDYAKAISVADETLAIDPNSAEIQSSKALAEHLFNRKNNPGSADAADIRTRPDRVWAGFTADLVNTSIGPSVVWWATDRYGLQASYGQGTFTSYALRGLARFAAVWGLTPYAGIGYLNVERDADVRGVSTHFSGKSGEVLVGAIVPVTARSLLLSSVSANAIRLDTTANVNGQDLPVTMTYSPVTVSLSLVYAFK